MAKVKSRSPEELKKLLAARLKGAKKYREKFEEQWRINESTVFYANSRRPDGVVLTEDNLITIDQVSQSSDVGTVEMAVNYAWKFLRYIHSQASANPPSCIARPATPDSGDHLKADAADRCIRHGYQEEDAQEIFDDQTLKTLTYGNGWLRCFFDYTQGDAFDFEDRSRELTMQGKIVAYSPSTWDMWADPEAKSFRGAYGARYVFERCRIPLEEAKFTYPRAADALDAHVRTRQGTESTLSDRGAERDSSREDVVDIFYYTERALPINGMAGVQAVHLEDGTLLAPPTENRNPDAILGYMLLTDIDVPDQLYGKSFVEYIFRLQDILNRLDTSMVDAIAAHGVVRMVLPDGCEIEEEALSNSAWDYVKITGNAGTGPYFVPPAQLMPDIHKLRENLIQGIQEMAGVNDSMLGQVKREMSGFSLQTAIDAGNQTRRRFFNKYTLCVRDFWKAYLANAREFWDDPRLIMVLGHEKSFESAEFTGADIDGGFNVVVEYGASLSLDPARRREEIMQLMPVFEKAGVKTQTILSMLRLNELDTLYDRMELAADRQREVFEEMNATGKYVPPKDLEDHAGMLDFAYYYLMTATFKYLDDEDKDRIRQHVLAREQLSAKTATQGQPAAPGGAGAAAAATALAGGAPPGGAALAAGSAPAVAPAA